ncbi:MAG: YidC/Oxa1 family membrane protein insertase [Candidatus Paceibacterota bacterium]
MFHTLFLEPIYNIVVMFLNIIPGQDIGIAIILTTLLVKIVLLPLNLSSQRSSYLMREAQVEIDEIKKKHSGDNRKIAEETMILYKEKKIKPFTSILTLIIQLPVFFALYFVFKDGIKFEPSLIYSFVHFPQNIEHLAFGFLDITKHYWWIGVLTGISMFIFSKRQADTLKKMSGNKNNENKNDFKSIFAKNMQMQMTYLLPIISGFSAAVLPGVIGVYWTINNILNIFQDIYIKRKLNIEKFIKEHKNN